MVGVWFPLRNAKAKYWFSCRPRLRQVVQLTLVFLLLQASAQVVAEGNVLAIRDLGLLNWVDYRKIQLSGDVTEISIIQDDGQLLDASAYVHETVVFHNQDDREHRLVFGPDELNTMGHTVYSPLIKPGERWGIAFVKDGLYPVQCALHPAAKGQIEVQW